MPTLFELGDAIRGDRVAINARRLGRQSVIATSGRHEAQAITASDEVICVIEKPLRVRPREHRGP